MVVYDRTDSSRSLAEGLSLRGAVVSVVDTIRGAQTAVAQRPVLTAFVWVTQLARTESTVAEQDEHLCAVAELVGTARSPMPLVLWGPGSERLVRAAGTRAWPVHIHAGGTTEESLVGTLAHEVAWSSTPA
jgi:hypothetical protein